jgi:uncharacterized protein DUF559
MANRIGMPTENGKVRVSAVAVRQFGRISRAQLIREEIGDGVIGDWLCQGYLHRCLPGVFAVGHLAPSVEGDLAAALLYAGEGAMLSHATAIWWLGLSDKQPYLIQISSPGRRASRGRFKIHCRRRIERVWHNRLPVTPVAQALLDYAASASFNRLRHALAEAEYRGLLDLYAVQAVLGRGRRGSCRLRAALERHMPQLARTRSELERIFLPVCEAAGLPLPEVNVTVEGILVDALWRDQKLVVELDGGPAHLPRARMVRDRRNEVKLRTAGHAVLRYSSDQVTDEPELVTADLVRELQSRGLSRSATLGG